MKQHEAKQFLPLIEAWSNGKTMQCNLGDGSGWFDIKEPRFDVAPTRFRIKPEPKLRAWKRGDKIPIGALHKDACCEFPESVISAVDWDETGEDEKCILLGEIWYSPEELLGDSYSTDGGKTFLPCGVMEAES